MTTWMFRAEAAKALGLSPNGLEKRRQRNAVNAKKEKGVWLYEIPEQATNGTDEGEGWVPIPQAAQQLGMSYSAVLWRANHGLIKSKKVGDRWWVLPKSNAPRMKARSHSKPPLPMVSGSALDILGQDEIRRLAMIGLRYLLEREG